MIRVRVFDIRWDTDGENIPLPEELFFEVDDGEEAEAELSDMISDQVGFCHFGFQYEVV